MKSIQEEVAEFLAEGEFKTVFGWIDKATVGQIDFLTNTITLNVLLMVASVYIHEMTHKQHPNFSEEEVHEATERKVNRMSDKRIQNLGRKLLETTPWK